MQVQTICCKNWRSLFKEFLEIVKRICKALLLLTNSTEKAYSLSTILKYLYFYTLYLYQFTKVRQHFCELKTKPNKGF